MSFFLNTFCPLAATKPGREASENHGLPPFIDGSIRREPDFEHEFPAISCLCRSDKFAPRLRPGDTIAYISQKARYGKPTAHRRLAAILRVTRTLPSHAAGAEWYRARGLALPSNCHVKDNDPQPLDWSHRRNPETRHLPDDERLRRWDASYRMRARQFPIFVICRSVLVDTSWQAPIVHDEDLIAVFGRIPGTQNPGKYADRWLDALVAQLQISLIAV